MSITKRVFGTLSDGTTVYRYTMQNKNAMTVSVMEYGAAVTEVIVPDRNGVFADVAGGFDDPKYYEKDESYMGSIVGRFANRIKGAVFMLDGVRYHVSANAGNDLMHGGFRGFTFRMWDITPRDGEEPALVCRCFSPDGEEGFPGNMQVEVTYTLCNDNTLSVAYRAVSDKKTVINLTNHSYFNLGGFGAGDIFDHELWVDADTYLPLTPALVPTGEILPVAGTPFDFTTPKTIGRDYVNDHPHFAVMGGYDVTLNFVGGKQKTPVLRAVAYHPASGRELRIFTDQPCVQLYTANDFYAAERPMKGGVPQHTQAIFCLETQGMPDDMDRPDFRSPVIDAGEEFFSVTEFSFGIR